MRISVLPAHKRDNYNVIMNTAKNKLNMNMNTLLQDSVYKLMFQFSHRSNYLSGEDKLFKN